MNIKKIIHKNLSESHDLIRHDDSIDLLVKATDSLADATRYLECLTQKLENKDCNEAIIRILHILKHPMGGVSGGNFNEKEQSNILSMLEMISTIIGREKIYKKNKPKLEEY